ncbi:hypothetical protein Tco_0847334 [Tanacetum coccineum]
MDKVITSMCKRGYGRASFARVLIDIDAVEGIVYNVEIWYQNLNRTMKLRVEYAWQPPIFPHCCVFGHNYKGCNFRVLSDEEKTERSAAKVHESAKQSNASGFGYGRGGMNMGRERKFVPVKDNDKEKVLALAEDNEEGKDDKENEWQGVRINIDVACDIGIPIDKEESSK